MASELETLTAIQQHGDLNPVQASRLKELSAAGSGGNPTGVASTGTDFSSGAPTSADSGSVSGDMNSYLANYQKQVIGSLAPDAVDANGNVNYSAISSALTPTSDAPAPINRVEMFKDLQTQYGVDALQSSVNDLKDQQRALDAQTRVNVSAERGKPVAQNIVEGRVSEQTRNAQEQYDFLSRQIAYKTDQLNSAYNTINTLVNFAGLDYNDAVTKYNTEFSQNMSILSYVQSTRAAGVSEYSTVNTIANQKEQLKLQQAQFAQDSARANLQIMANAITSGNVDPSKLTSDQKLQMTKLETQAGLPAGFVSSLGLSNKDKILFTNTNNGVTQVGIQAADGSISVKSYGTPTGGGTAAQKEQQYTSTAQQDATNGATLKQMVQIYQGFLAPDKIYQIYNANSPYDTAKETPQELIKLGIGIPSASQDKSQTNY